MTRPWPSSRTCLMWSRARSPSLPEEEERSRGVSPAEDLPIRPASRLSTTTFRARSRAATSISHRRSALSAKVSVSCSRRSLPRKAKADWLSIVPARPGNRFSRRVPGSGGGRGGVYTESDIAARGFRALLQRPEPRNSKRLSARERDEEAPAPQRIGIESVSEVDPEDVVGRSARDAEPQ